MYTLAMMEPDIIAIRAEPEIGEWAERLAVEPPYMPAYCKLLVAYYMRAPDVDYAKSRLKLGAMPSLLGFARHIRVSLATIDAWIMEHPDFAVAAQTARSIEREWLIAAGLSGHVDGRIAKLVLANRHGWVDRAELSGPGGSAVSVDLDAYIRLDHKRQLAAEVGPSRDFEGEEKKGEVSNEKTEEAEG